MTPLAGLEWVGVACVGLLVVSLLVEAFRGAPPPLVRVDVVDSATGELVATFTHAAAPGPPSSARAGSVTAVATTVQKPGGTPARLPENVAPRN